MKVSEISPKQVKEYLKEEEISDEKVKELLNASIQYIMSYTGLSAEQMDAHEEFWIAVMILCQDMLDNRSLYVDKDNINHTVQTILDMHSINLL